MIAAAVLALFSAAPVKQTRTLMHTRVTIAIAEPAAPDADFDAAFAVFREVEAVMNEWAEDSPLGRVNAQAAEQPVPAPPALCEVIRLALDGAKRTNGLFDPTWAALKDLWRFSDPNPPVPDPKAVKDRCALVSWKHVELKPAADGACTVKFAKPGVKLGLGGIAKGWGVDRAAQVLRSAGHHNFFIQAGGDLYLAGKNGDRAWKVGIREPRGSEAETFAKAEVGDATFSTSGDYERFFEKDGVRYHHLIDPRTCQPARRSVSATVLARTGVDAEVLTKAAFIAGWPQAEALAAAAQAKVVVVDPDGAVHASKGIAAFAWTPPKGLRP